MATYRKVRRIQRSNPRQQKTYKKALVLYIFRNVFNIKMLKY